MKVISDEDFDNILFFIINSRHELFRVLRELSHKGNMFYKISLAKEYIARAENILAQFDKEEENEKK